MAKKSRKDLKNYFQTKSIPTQGNFEDLVDSVPNFEDDSCPRGLVFYPKDPKADNKHVLAIYDKDPQLGGQICWSIGINKNRDLAFYNAEGEQRASFTQKSKGLMENCTSRGQDDIEVNKIFKFDASEITVMDDIFFSKNANFKYLEVDELRVNTITPMYGSSAIELGGTVQISNELSVDKIKPNKSDAVSIEGVLKDIEKLVAKNIESVSIVTDYAAVKKKITSKVIESIMNILFYNFLIETGLSLLRAGVDCFVYQSTTRSKMPTGGNMYNVIGWLKKKLDDNPAIKEMITNYGSKKLVEMVDCLDVIKDVNLQAIIDRNNLSKLIEKTGLSKLVEKSGVLDDSQRTVALIRKKNEEFASEGFRSYPIVVVTNKKPILLCANHTQENEFEVYPTKYVEGDANVKINWIDDHETDEKKLILEYLPGNSDEHILYGMIKTDITDNATVKNEFTSRGDLDMEGPIPLHFQILVGMDMLSAIIYAGETLVAYITKRQTSTEGNIDINNVIDLLKKKLDGNPAMRRMIANYDLKKLVETIDHLDIIKNVNLLAKIDRNNFSGLIEKMDIFKLVEKNGVLDDAQRTVTLIRKKNEEFAGEEFHSYPIVVVTNKKPILLCANHTQENEFEIYPRKYAEGNENFKLNWVDDHEADEKTLILEFLSNEPDEFILYGMIKTDLA